MYARHIRRAWFGHCHSIVSSIIVKKLWCESDMHAFDLYGSRGLQHFCSVRIVRCSASDPNQIQSQSMLILVESNPSVAGCVYHRCRSPCRKIGWVSIKRSTYMENHSPCPHVSHAGWGLTDRERSTWTCNMEPWKENRGLHCKLHCPLVVRRYENSPWYAANVYMWYMLCHSISDGT